MVSVDMELVGMIQKTTGVRVFVGMSHPVIVTSGEPLSRYNEEEDSERATMYCAQRTRK